MDVPGLGFVDKDSSPSWLRSRPINVQLFGGKECRIVLDGYEDDSDKGSFHVAIRNFLGLPSSGMEKVKPYLFEYYLDFKEEWEDCDPKFKPILAAKDVLQFVRLNNNPIVSRRAYGDKGVYVSIDGGCDWEPEHGVQIVLREGKTLCKVGPYNGHLTNSDATGDGSFEKVIYRRWRS